MEILVGRERYIGALDTDLSLDLNLYRESNIYSSEHYHRIINQLKWFENEREKIENYLLYGKIEYLIDDALKKNVNDFKYEIGYVSHILPLPGELLDIIGVVDRSPIVEMELFEGDVIGLFKDDELKITKIIAVDKVAEGYKLDLDTLQLVDGTYKIVPPNVQYRRVFKKMHEGRFMKHFKSAFSTNIYGEQIYQFNTFKDLNLSGVKNNLGQPIDELVLKISLDEIDTITFTAGTVDIVRYNLNDLTMVKTHDNYYELYQLPEQINFRYKPYNIFKLKEYSEVLTSTHNSEVFNIPEYAIRFFDGNVHFRDIVKPEEGLNHPFMNGLHYVYKDIKFFVRRSQPIATYNNYDNELLDYDITIIGDTKNNRLC